MFLSTIIFRETSGMLGMPANLQIEHMLHFHRVKCLGRATTFTIAEVRKEVSVTPHLLVTCRAGHGLGKQDLETTK